MKAWDTNFLLRHLLEDDPGQLRIVRNELEKAQRRNDRAWISHIALIETAWVLGGLLEKNDVLDVISAVLADDRFLVQEPQIVEEAVARTRISGDLPEHLIAGVGGAHGCARTQTFDQAVRGFEEFEVLTPASE